MRTPCAKVMTMPVRFPALGELVAIVRVTPGPTWSPVAGVKPSCPRSDDPTSGGVRVAGPGVVKTRGLAPRYGWIAFTENVVSTVLAPPRSMRSLPEIPEMDRDPPLPPAAVVPAPPFEVSVLPPAPLTTKSGMAGIPPAAPPPPAPPEPPEPQAGRRPARIRIAGPLLQIALVAIVPSLS